MVAVWFHRQSTKTKWTMTKSDDNIALSLIAYTRSKQSFVIATHCSLTAQTPTHSHTDTQNVLHPMACQRRTAIFY